MTISALVTTAGAANANAYVSLAEADQYHDDRPQFDTRWDDANFEERTQAILMSTKLLDRLVFWTGQSTTMTQALLWPRVGMYYRRGDNVPADVIPEELKWANAEHALQLLRLRDQENPALSNKDQLEELAFKAHRLGLSSVQAPTVSISLKDTANPFPKVPSDVLELMPDDWYTLKGSVVELLRA